MSGIDKDSAQSQSNRSYFVGSLGTFQQVSLLRPEERTNRKLWVIIT
jgi:hypothetical protein